MVELSSIQNAAMLAGLGQSEILELESIARAKGTVKGERLFRRGDEAKTFYLLKEGKFVLTIEARAFDDHFEMPIEEKVAGDALGWSSLVEPRRSIYSAYCTQGGSVVAFSSEELEAMMSSDPNLGHRFARNLNQLIGSRIRALQQLWIEEVERSTERVVYWSHTELSNEWFDVVKPPRRRVLR